MRKSAWTCMIVVRFGTRARCRHLLVARLARLLHRHFASKPGDDVFGPDLLRCKGSMTGKDGAFASRTYGNSFFTMQKKVRKFCDTDRVRIVTFGEELIRGLPQEVETSSENTNRLHVEKQSCILVHIPVRVLRIISRTVEYDSVVDYHELFMAILQHNYVQTTPCTTLVLFRIGDDSNFDSPFFSIFQCVYDSVIGERKRRNQNLGGCVLNVSTTLLANVSIEQCLRYFGI